MIKHILCLLLLLTSFLSTKADEIPTDNDSIVMSYTGNEIVIQSFKRNDDITIQPISATILTDKTIKDRNITNIKEISSTVPNLFMPDYGSKMISPVYVRGIGSRINAPSVGLYVDGVPYFDRSSFDFNMNDVERIEVLRGPQGTIYGRNTMGGIINVYTKSPFKYKETNVSLSAANYNTYEASASHYGKINNTFGYGVSGNYLHTGGYFDNIFTHKKADPMDAVSGRIRLSWHAAPQLYVHLTSVYEYSDQDGYPYAPYDDKTGHLSKIDYDAPSYYRRNMSTTGLNVQYSTDKVRFNSQSSFQYFDGRQGIDQDFTSKSDYYVVSDQSQQMYSQEFNLKSIGERRYEWLVGAFGFYQNYKTFNHISYLNEAFKGLQSFQDIKTPTGGVALFHQSRLKDIFIKGLSATLGLRYDWEEIRATTNLYKTTTAKPIPEYKEKKDKEKYSQLTPKFALEYTFMNDELVYASITRGYKTGGFNNTAEVENDRIFSPEYSWSYEIGTKASCFDKLFYTDISLFYIDWNDQQVSQYQPSGQGYIIKNAGKSTSKGFEVSMHANPISNLSLSLGYGYTYAKFKKFDTERTITNQNGETELEKVDYSGKFLPMVPRHTFTAGANYGINFKNKNLLDKIMLNAQYTGAGRLYWREDNEASQSFYGMINAKATFVRKNISLDLWAKNIASQKYISYYFKAQAGTFAQAGKPFTCGLNINMTF